MTYSGRIPGSGRVRFLMFDMLLFLTVEPLAQLTEIPLYAPIVLAALAIPLECLVHALGRERVQFIEPADLAAGFQVVGVNDVELAGEVAVADAGSFTPRP